MVCNILHQNLVSTIDFSLYKRNCLKAGFVSILFFDWTYHLYHCSVTKHNWSVSTNTWPTNCASYFMAELLSVAEFIGRVFGCAYKFAITDMISTNCHIVKLALLLIIQFFSFSSTQDLAKLCLKFFPLIFKNQKIINLSIQVVQKKGFDVLNATQTRPFFSFFLLICYAYLDPIGLSFTQFDLLGANRSYLDLFGAIKSYSELFGAIWSHLQPFGAILILLELFGAILRNFDLFGLVWSCLFCPSQLSAKYQF